MIPVVQMEDDQEKLMGVIDGITADGDMKEKDDLLCPPSLIVPLFRFPLPQPEGSVQSTSPPEIGVADSVTSRRLSKERKGKLQRGQKGTKTYRAPLWQGCKLKSLCTLCTQDHLPRHYCNYRWSCIWCDHCSPSHYKRN